jgi:hypothetical protein
MNFGDTRVEAGDTTDAIHEESVEWLLSSDAIVVADGPNDPDWTPPAADFGDDPVPTPDPPVDPALAERLLHDEVLTPKAEA